MNFTNQIASDFSVFEPALHALYECQSADAFRRQFETTTGTDIASVADNVVDRSAQKAIFLVGSIPLGMGTAGSDVDLIVIVGSNAALLPQKGGGIVNGDQSFGFTNEANPIVVGTFVTLMNGVAVEVQVAVASSINRTYARLKARGPELSESEIMTLGRLSKGWLLWQTDDFLVHNSVTLEDPALHIYCSTKSFVSAEIFRRKARKVSETGDIPLALHLGRSSVEMAYVAYFASEGYSYLGAKWLAQIGHARDAAERVTRIPLLKDGLSLLFPRLQWSAEEVQEYLRSVAEFVESMRNLIEQKTLFRIAFHACPQIHDIRRRRRA